MAVSDTDLIVKAQHGDSLAFEELIYRYDRNVLSMALKFTSDADDAKDIYQEVFIRVFRGLKKFQFRSEFSTWLFRITTNVCISFKRSKKKHDFISINEDDNEDGIESRPLLVSSEDSSPERYADNSEISVQVNNALELLSSKQKMVFVLKHYEGYKIKEIASMLKCGEGTVKKYLFDGIRKLRYHLKDYY